MNKADPWGVCVSGGLTQDALSPSVPLHLGNGMFPSSEAKASTVVNLTGNCYSSPHLGCISMTLDLCGVFVYAVHCVTGSVGSSGKNRGTRLQRSSG